MKTLNKCIVFFLFINFSFASNASKFKLYKEDLVSRMSNDKNLDLLYGNCAGITFASYAINLGAENNEDINKIRNERDVLINENQEIMKNIKNDFPEFAKLNLNEQKEIFNDILNTSVMKASSNKRVQCIGWSILGFAGCAIGTMATYEAFYFGSCMYSAIKFDIAEVVTASIGGPLGAAAAIAAVAIAQIEIEAAGCIAIATGATIVKGSPVVMNCLTAAWGYVMLECTRL